MGQAFGHSERRCPIAARLLDRDKLEPASLLLMRSSSPRARSSSCGVALEARFHASLGSNRARQAAQTLVTDRTVVVRVRGLGCGAVAGLG